MIKQLLNTFSLFVALSCVSTLIFAQIPSLSSYPAGDIAIYLDFDGETVNGTTWNSSYNDGNTIEAAEPGYDATFITEAWNRVAEDFRPFKVNVTTNLEVFESYPMEKRTQVIITPTNDWYPDAGGVAFIGSLWYTNNNPCWTFAFPWTSAKIVAEISSHEAGHTLGLYHQSAYLEDGTYDYEYYDGKGSGETSWAPIMGVSYYNNHTTWSSGHEHASEYARRDDLAILNEKFQSSTGSDAHRYDDHGNTTQVASALQDDGFGNVQAAGIIEVSEDKDLFSFYTETGVVSFTIEPFSVDEDNEGANMNPRVSILDQSGSVVKVFSELNQLDLSFSQTLAAGNYFLQVESDYSLNHSTYGAIGMYSIEGTVVADLNDNTSNTITVLEMPEFLSVGATHSIKVAYDVNVNANIGLNLLSSDIWVTRGSGYRAVSPGKGVVTIDLSVGTDAPVDFLHFLQAKLYTADWSGDYDEKMIENIRVSNGTELSITDHNQVINGGLNIEAFYSYANNGQLIVHVYKKLEDGGRELIDKAYKSITPSSGTETNLFIPLPEGLETGDYYATVELYDESWSVIEKSLTLEDIVVEQRNFIQVLTQPEEITLYESNSYEAKFSAVSSGKATFQLVDLDFQDSVIYEQQKIVSGGASYDFSFSMYLSSFHEVVPKDSYAIRYRLTNQDKSIVYHEINEPITIAPTVKTHGLPYTINPGEHFESSLQYSSSQSGWIAVMLFDTDQPNWGAPLFYAQTRIENAGSGNAIVEFDIPTGLSYGTNYGFVVDLYDDNYNRLAQAVRQDVDYRPDVTIEILNAPTSVTAGETFDVTYRYFVNDVRGINLGFYDKRGAWIKLGGEAFSTPEAYTEEERTVSISIPADAVTDNQYILWASISYINSDGSWSSYNASSDSRDNIQVNAGSSSRQGAEELLSKVSMYPNPVAQGSDLSIDGLKDVALSDIMVINTLGQNVSTQVTPFLLGETLKINTSNLASGTYTLVIDTDLISLRKNFGVQ